MEKIDLFKPRFRGKRFTDSTLPFDLLADLAVYQSLLLQVAKDLYYEQNPDRKRVPNGFGNGVYLKLAQIEEGSTIPNILLAAASFVSGDFDSRPLFEAAQTRIEHTISVAASDGNVGRMLSPTALAHFNSFGKNLRDDEAVDFNNSETYPATLTQASRRVLVLSSPTASTFETRVVLRGSVAAISKDPMNFTVVTPDGRMIIPVSPSEYKTVEQAYLQYENAVRVKIEGIGVYNRKNVLESIKYVGSIVFLDQLDVSTRLETFMNYKDGWLNGDGEAFRPQDLKWLSDQFDFYFNTELLLPFVFPTAEGGIQFEWKNGQHDATLEINLADRSAYYHYYNSTSGEFTEITDWNFSDAAAWDALGQELSKYFIVPGNQTS